MAYTNPTVSDFKTYFDRDFVYGSDNSTVKDSDITKAFTEVDATLNSDLFGSQEIYTLGYLLLAAHDMVMNLRASNQGVSGQFEWLQNSKSVGSVSEGLSIPERILNNPEYSYLTKTNYGAKYLMLILPKLTGQIFSVAGWTRP